MKENLKKLMGGRYVLTIVTACVFAYLASTGKMPAQTSADIIKTVIMFYFLKGAHEITSKKTS